MSYKGKFKPINPEKYKGDSTKIIWRSLWELKVFRYLDVHPDIIEWSSEEIVIPYLSPIDGKMHRYFPDLYIKTKNNEKIIVEIKPKKQTIPPDPSRKNQTKTGRVSKRYLNEVKTYGINEAKWKYAEQYCKEKGWKFMILTEDQIKPGKK